MDTNDLQRIMSAYELILNDVNSHPETIEKAKKNSMEWFKFMTSGGKEVPVSELLLSCIILSDSLLKTVKKIPKTNKLVDKELH